MKPLHCLVVALSILAVQANRVAKCTTCGSGKLHGPGDILAAIQALPGSEVHSQSSFEGCSTEKGCAGIKVKDGQVIEKYGNIDAFKQAQASNIGNEFQFHAAGSNIFQNGLPSGGFWWMNENSPFKNVAAGGNFEKYSSSSSSSYSSNGGNAALDLSGNPFLNGDITKLNSGFSNQPGSNFQSSFESSSYSNSQNGAVDLSKNPYLNGGYQKFGSQSSNKFNGYTGSSPSPFTASTAGSNNLIQNSNKKNEFQYEQQSQQNIDEIFQETGNVHAHEHNGGELQQTCAGQGYVCVHRAQCNNGVVNTNGVGILQAKTKKQYCNIKTEICCRIEISTLQNGAGNQGSLGVGSATFSGSTNQGGLFASSSSGQSGQSGQAGSSSSFGSSQSGSNSFGSQGAFGQSEQGQRGSGFGGSSQGSFESSQSSFESSSFGSSNRGSVGGQAGIAGQAGISGQAGSVGSNQFGGSNFGSSGSSFGSNSNGFGTNNRGVTVESNSFESSTTRETFGSGNTGLTGSGSTTSGTKYGQSGFQGNNNNFGSSSFGSNTNTNKYGGVNTNNNEVVKTTNTQTNFVETDSFSSGSESTGIYRPGSSGSGLKPGVPYLPPVDNSNSDSNVVSSTAFTTTYSATTPRPIYTTQKPAYLPPVSSTAAPGYLPPEGEQTINTETRVPPNPNYNEGSIILDETRNPRPKTPQPGPPAEIPAGCAAALKCTPIEYCTAEGVISDQVVALTRDQETYRVPLTDCKDLETGRLGKCCRDSNYTDPWPTNLIGKWVPGVFGGNDGKYVPDSRGSPNNPRPASVTARPTPAPITGSVVLNNFRTTPKPSKPFGPNQVTPGYPSSTTSQSAYGQKGQFEVKGQGQYAQGGQGQYSQGSQGSYSQGSQTQFAQGSQGQQGQFGQAGQGQFGQAGQGQFAQGGQGQYAQGGQGQFGQGAQGTQSQFSQNSFTQTQSSFGQKGQGQAAQGQGQFGQQGQGQFGQQGQGQFTQQGQGQYSQGSKGQFGQGQLEIQEQGSQGQFGQVQGSRGQGQQVAQGQSQTVNQGFSSQGQFASQGQGQIVSQGVGQGIRQGQGFAVSQGQGVSVENEYSESAQRVFLQSYNAGGECGLLNGQKPYGNRNENEVDFAEIPWQAMVLLQTNRSLLCGGVITRPDVVVTTASCVEGLLAKNVLIKGGEWKLGIDDEPLPFQIVQVKNILRHPFYKSGSYQYDAAILVLTENLRLAKNIYPICLPGPQETLDAFYNGAGECIVTGWGKQVLQAHLAGSILHSLNVSLINPGECQDKLAQDYPHLLAQYDQESCACGQPTNPINNICRVDIGSALACTTGDGHFVFRGVYSWDSGCQPGNQLAAFYKFDMEWYNWAIGLIESVRFAQFSSGTQQSSNRYSGQIKGQSQFGNQAVKGGSQFGSQSVKGSSGYAAAGFNQYGFNQASATASSFGIKQPVQNAFSASYSQKKVFQSEPQIVTYTTKPEIVTFTTKPEFFTYTTKPKIVSYTTKPQFISYETSGSGNNPQYIAPGVTYNPTFGDAVGAHVHNAQCKCDVNGKK